jgi:hypothetical protein
MKKISKAVVPLFVLLMLFATGTMEAQGKTTEDKNILFKGNHIYLRAITRNEILERAKSWAHIGYSQSGYASDPEDCHLFRTDCSGFITMAWHVAVNTGAISYVTAEFGDYYSICREIPLRELMPGDALVSGSIHHALLFEKWDNTSRSSFHVYQMTNTALDWRHSQLSASEISLRGYKAYRYNNIIAPSNKRYTVRFFKNGGTNEHSMTALSVPCGEPVKLPLCTIKKEGYSFLGWNVFRHSDSSVSGEEGWIPSALNSFVPGEVGLTILSDGQRLTSLSEVGGDTITLVPAWKAIALTQD